jgi:hypothetical protein
MATVNNQKHPLLLKRFEAQQLLGLGPSKYKQLVAAGVLKEVAIGERGRRLPYTEAERFVVEGLAASGDDGR